MTIEQIIAKVNKKHGEGTIVRASDALGLEIKKFSTGSFALDVSLGGGWAEGRINQIAGRFSSYKTTLSICSGSQYLAKGPGRIVVWVDVENSFDVRWLKFLDADPDRFLLVSPVSGEEAVDVMYEIMKEGTEVLVVIDSIAALVGAKETSEPMKKNTVGAQPRFLSKMIRKILPLLRKDLLSPNPKSTVLALNQVRVQIGQLFGDPEQPTGGKSIEHASSIGVKLRRSSHIHEEMNAHGETVKQTVGAEVAYTVFKNKTGGNVGDKGVFSFYNRAKDFRVGGSIDNAGDLIPFGVVYGFIKRKGQMWHYKKISARGRKAFIKKLSSDKRAVKALYKEVLEHHIERVTRKYDRPVKRKKETADYTF